ncbi:3-deoxy-8-phosphooctulonate synthase [Cerasicoccus arenae]|uniref:2-dehydro-3-deoxyphosphooctonate aldolase n=1 Tax=Cerasicoccus arenae TaxID=424488 RepID=A0A8J3GEN4_9BACT|nr:3-deoxy-8-phosphooctulonate synthase [Cerasicoccus arenae]MBK1858633.1 3-deoxy-8-phosphooctulonate synthase [Cerasicoccus arenae]GHC04873.1 2-dehydro-3-deoxyphosphooctonate aldolase [Cerasicoccus arenae]
MKPLIFIAGPCALENWDICAPVAEQLVRWRDEFACLQLTFKGSFDKANRTSLDSPRGPGIDEGLALLARVKQEFGLPVLTDFHLPQQAAAVGEVCDVLQVPAFLCRQTDLLVAAAETGRIVNVKKGQFLSPFEMEYVVRKLEGANAKEIWLTERGSTFGYQNLVADMRNFSIMGQWGHPVIFDATHSVQIPGGAGGQSGGQREFVLPLARAALAAGADGLFLETHPEPSQAISDAQSQVPLEELKETLPALVRLWEALN